MPLFQTEDVKVALPSAIKAFQAGKPRLVITRQGFTHLTSLEERHNYDNKANNYYWV